MNIHYEQVKNEDIIYFWENFIFTSIYSSQKTSKKNQGKRKKEPFNFDYNLKIETRQLGKDLVIKKS